MAQGAIDLSRPQPDQTRTELTLERIGRSWGYSARGGRFTRALLDFLRAKGNRNTLRSYSFSILEFFGWYEREKRRIPLPDQVRRADAIEYERWLRSRKYGLRDWYLRNDPERKLDAAIYEFVKRRPEARIDAIRAELLRRSEFVTWRNVEREGRLVTEKVLTIDAHSSGGLGKRLACLVDVKTLKRSPSIAQIRRGDVDVGLAPGVARRIGIDYPVPPQVFQYVVPEDDSSSAERASTIVTRLGALSALWRYLMRSGENDEASQPLLRVDIWDEVARGAQRQAPSHRKARRAAKTPGLTLFERLLATTFRRHGPNALQMAAAQMRPGVVPEPPRSPGKETFANIRDRAVMLLLAQTGLRSEELGTLRRRDIAGDPPLLTVVGKGGKKRRVRVPPAALTALRALSNKLAHMADHQRRYGNGYSRAQMLLEADSPLLPALSRWGKNAESYDRELRRGKGLTRQGIAMMLRRRALQARIPEGSADFARIHPHGLRHLFAKTAIEGGTPVNVVQAVMGHASGATTLRYMEEHEPTALIAQPFAAPPTRAPLPPAPRPPPRPMPPAPAAVMPEAIPTLELPPEPLPPAPAPPPPTPTPFVAPPPSPPPDRPSPALPVERVVAPPPPIVPPEGRLVAYGAPPPPPADAEEVAREETLANLRVIYEQRWGEKGRRARLRTAAQEVPIEMELAQLGGSDEFEAMLGITPELGVGAQRLINAYIGKHSGLIWWGGPSGALKPEMAVMSPQQMADCGEERQTDVCARLVGLWQRWMDSPHPGPTAASALVGWFVLAMDVSAQVQQQLETRRGEWLPYDAPWGETAEQDVPRRLFREQEPEAVAYWFEQVAWQYRLSTTGKQAIGAPFEPPPYYGEADPLATLEEAELTELLDWIGALSGQQPLDRTPRFNGVSRRDVAQFIQRMCFYDQQLDLVRELRAGGMGFERRAAEASAARAAAEVNRLAQLLGSPRRVRIDVPVPTRVAALARVAPGTEAEAEQEAAAAAEQSLALPPRLLVPNEAQPFDIVAETKKRVSERKAGKPREYRRDFYLRMVRRLFGDAAAEDAALRIVALCGKAPLADPEFAPLFRIDPVRRTIVHDRSFARKFGEDTGAHSECVGRRIAMDLWGIMKRHRAGDKQRMVSTRPDELQDYVETLMAWRVPCPADQERELRTFVRSAKPLPVYQAWERARRRQDVHEDPRRAAVEADLMAFDDLYGDEIVGEYLGEIFQPNPGKLKQAWRRLPSPYHLIAAVMLR